MQPLGDRAPREWHQLVLRLELLRLSVCSVAKHEAVVGRADDLRARLERHLHDRVVAADEPWRAERLDADVAMCVDREDLRAEAGVGHLDELGERPLFAVVELDLRVTGEATEVPLPLHERRARREILREAHERVVDRDVAVRVVLRHHLADNRGGLPEGPVVPEAHLVHCVEDPALNRLQAVAHVRQRARDDDAHRVVEIRLAHLLLELDTDHAVVAGLFDHRDSPLTCVRAPRPLPPRSRPGPARTPRRSASSGVRARGGASRACAGTSRPPPRAPSRRPRATACRASR